MRKVYLDGLLGDKFGYEWNLAVNTVGEAISAIACQRKGFREHLLADTAGYEVIFDKEDGVEQLSELAIKLPPRKSIRIVPVVSGKKSGGLLMVVAGIALIAATGGFAAFAGGAAATTGAAGGAALAGTTANMATLTATYGSAAVAQAGVVAGQTITLAQAASLAGTSQTAILGFTAAAKLGTGLVLAGVSTMLAPKVSDGGAGAKQAENYLFNGAINNAKQGAPIPLVYGRTIIGSTVIAASLFTSTSRRKISSKRKLVGISDFRTPGSRYGVNTAGTSTVTSSGSGNGHAGGSGHNGTDGQFGSLK